MLNYYINYIILDDDLLKLSKDVTHCLIPDCQVWLSHNLFKQIKLFHWYWITYKNHGARNMVKNLIKRANYFDSCMAINFINKLIEITCMCLVCFT